MGSAPEGPSPGAVGGQQIDHLEHERIVIAQDPASGLRAVIAVHSTLLGPALGGLRILAYRDGLDGALADAAALARAMTAKAAAAGLELGGGKAVILDDGDDSGRTERLRALGRAVEQLGGAYVTAEDVGTTPADMEVIAQETSYVVGRDRAGGAGGDPSPATAETVLAAIRLGLEFATGSGDPAGRRVGVVGVGKVGGRVARALAGDGAELVICDARAERAAALVAETGARVLPDAAAILGEPLDVLAPCATGGLIDAGAAASLDCRVIAGAANNQLAGEQTDKLLARRGILHVPDVLANCGGLIHVAAEWRGEDDASATAQLDAAVERMRGVLEQATVDGRAPQRIVDELVARRLGAAAGRAAGDPEPSLAGSAA